MNENKKEDILYWAGCTASYLENDIAKNGMRLLRDGGLDPETLGEDEWCCGVPFLMAGKWDKFEEIFKHNIEEIKKRDVDKVVASCPGCWVTLSHYYEDWAEKLGEEWGMEVEHITEILSDMIEKNKLEFSQDLDQKVTYHDPCHIGRHGDIYDEPRDVIDALPGVKNEEMRHNKEDALCCGSVLTRVGDQEVSKNLANLRLEEAKETGADRLVTTCPCCEFQFRVGAKENNIDLKTVDIATLAAEAKGYETEDPTPEILSMWFDVFKKAIDNMSPEGMVSMMDELMPVMMDNLPSPMNKIMTTMSVLPRPVQNAGLKMMSPMIPYLVPRMLDDMIPDIAPEAAELMKERIPKMPENMEKNLDQMLVPIMKEIMPHMLPEIMPELKPMMIKGMKDKMRA
ncbi:hypothetical protein C9439_06275 [archaeon SCG-AAA382B04]|nr:hypothetical protein C9439_06275 [archaeon SCG-AAA382B04]